MRISHGEARHISPDSTLRQELNDAIPQQGGQDPDRTAEAILAWSQHVKRLVEDSRGYARRDSWGAHDFVAALFLRDLVASMVGTASGGQRDEMSARVRVADAEFLSFTEMDDTRMVQRFADETIEHREWWWNGRPSAGSIRLELDRWDA